MPVSAGPFSSSRQLECYGRPCRIRGNHGQDQQLACDGNGNVTRSTDAAGRATSCTYDRRNRMLTSTSPDGGVVRYGWDATCEAGLAADARPSSRRFSHSRAGVSTR